MPVRIYALAKQLKIDNQSLIEACKKAGVTVKGSALASLSDEEVAQVKAFLGGRGAGSASRAAGTALDFARLMELAETRAVRFMSVMSCTNGKQPFGMGLWEGVPLRDVVWLACPKSNVRRIFFYGYHNDDPAQRFQSSLPIGRVLEDPPGEHPVILCYKLNNEWLTPLRGGPVRVIVPEEYGNRSVKWLQRIMLTNSFKANDTYAEWNNDTVSHLKTCARFIHTPERIKVGEPAADPPFEGARENGVLDTIEDVTSPD